MEGSQSHPVEIVSEVLMTLSPSWEVSLVLSHFGTHELGVAVSISVNSKFSDRC